ncbi:aspartate--tRNA ligase, mitochondrial-like isoform X2 [Lycorma delicatula]|uniref:aspartate--tRNA ligase, mitochondrial-like isoform X2 n=1 Tax=Lycorma delicatula TaxID=130591 RepID=UPI003F5131EC
MYLPVCVAVGRGCVSNGIIKEFYSCIRAVSLSTVPSSRFTERTHTCNELNRNLVGTEVALRGWLQKKQSSNFFAFHDGYGQTNLFISDSDQELSKVAQNVQINSVVLVKGLVCLSRSHEANSNNSLNSVEVAVKEISIIEGKSNLSENKEKIDAQISSELLTNLTKDFKVAGVNKCCIRTHTCGELRGSDVGKHVRLCGWLQFQRMNKFATIRDSYGTTQLIIPDHLIDIVEVLVKTPIESTISVKGVVCTRPVDQVNPACLGCIMLTGEIEVTVVEFEVLNPAKPNLPFLIRDHNKAKEHLRLKHRYLDLRFPQMQRNLRLRSKFIMQMRDFLINHREFVEVETPTLFRRIPGAHFHFLVASNFSLHLIPSWINSFHNLPLCEFT